MIIRKMIIGDIDGILAIEKTCFTADAWSEEAFIYRLEDESLPFLNLTAEDENKVVGYLVATAFPWEMNIDSVAVSPDHRRKGIARELIKTAVALSKAEEITLEVRESNKPAVSLYESLGFEKVGNRKNYYQQPVENAVLMTKCIKK